VNLTTGFLPGERPDRCWNRVRGWVGLGLVLLAAGCGPSEPPVPAVPEKDEVAQRHEWLFGPKALAKDITWRPSGLGLRVTTPGSGQSPQPTDRVRVHYVGSLKDGRVVDDSRAKGKPLDFVLNRVIAGWTEGILALKPGGRADLFVPPSLGYGNAGVGDIPAGSGLIFEIELLEILPPAAPKA
jgi:FKBP-type peptidyl-prolyl cis-trans isomerase FklB